MSARVFISAGEPSGDLHAAAVLRHLKHDRPDLTVEAFGGPALAAAGALVRYPMERYTVLGFAEIVSKIPAHVRLLRTIERRFAAGEFDLALLVDYPGFHLRVAAAAHRAGVKVLYYVAPQLWAWRPERAVRLRAAVDRLAVILPFEADFFKSLGIPAEYVGHPLLDRPDGPTRDAARAELGFGASDRVLGLFPGSRTQEIERLWPAFRDTALRLLETGACDQVVIAATAHGHYPGAGPIRVHRGNSPVVLAAATAALVKSGTSTLEAALAGVPMVVAYRVHPFTSALARRLVRVSWISLVNLIAGRTIVKELLQGDVRPERLVEEMKPLLDESSPAARTQRAELARVRELLGGPGAAARVARMVTEMLP
jgi:lipid-A-disaccharide synthase